MRLFTHNFLQCHVRNCTKDNFPLQLKDAEISVKAADYNADFLAMQMCKIDYEALRATLSEVQKLVILGLCFDDLSFFVCRV